MALSQNLVQKQTQRLVITQDLRQSIELLPLSNQELSERIQQEILENPLLEDRGERGEPYDGGSEGSSESPAEEAAPSSGVVDLEMPKVAEPAREPAPEDAEAIESWKSGREEFREYTGDRAGSAERTEQKHQFLQNAVRSNESLSDHLLWQLRMSDASPEAVAAGEVLISAIDDRGFLIQPLDELIENTGVDLPTAGAALAQLHALDPIGCGARDIGESLLIQARILRPDDEISARLLKDHFEDLEKFDYKKIEKHTGYHREQIESSLQFVRTLEPYPATLYAPRIPEYIVPDVIVIEIDGQQEIIINDDWLPALGINEEYRNMLRSQGRGSDDREYLQTKLSSAQWLMKSIRQRRQTLYRVMKSILEFQADFFEGGHGKLKPLTLRMVAEQVELHESTVSRITTNKYAQTRWGVFELKYFFSSSLRSTGGGSDTHSARSIQDRIKQLVDEEDADHPLSDQEIMERIKSEGVQIARRTVAKYRKILKILPADRRKKLKKLNARGGG